MDTLVPYPDNDASAFASEHVNPLVGILVPLAAAVMSLLVTIIVYNRMT